MVVSAVRLILLYCANSHSTIMKFQIWYFKNEHFDSASMFIKWMNKTRWAGWLAFTTTKARTALITKFIIHEMEQINSKSANIVKFINFEKMKGSILLTIRPTHSLSTFWPCRAGEGGWVGGWFTWASISKKTFENLFFFFFFTYKGWPKKSAIFGEKFF